MAANGENEPTGIPTRAIHEAYLECQWALKSYRQASDRGDPAARERAHGEFQDAVLTLYELLRPHLLQNAAVSDYWNGEPPAYPSPDDPTDVPDPNDGTAVLAWQTHHDTVELNGADPRELTTLRDWADALDDHLDDRVRLVGVQPNGSVAMVATHVYQMGLEHLDGWRTRFETTESDMGGFFDGKSTKDTQRQRVPIEKLKRAARELANAAEKLGALSQFDASTPRTEITAELIEEVDEWRRETLGEEA